jgi:hypothetical protein
MELKGIAIEYFGSLPNRLNEIISKEGINIEYFYSNDPNMLGLVCSYNGEKIKATTQIPEDLIKMGMEFMVDHVSNFFIKSIREYKVNIL